MITPSSKLSPRFIPNYAEYRVFLGRIYLDAVTYYQRLYGLDRDPQRRQLVKLLVSLNRYKDAIPLQDEEVAKFPEDQEAIHFQALLHYWQRDYRAASDIYQLLLEKSAENSGLRLEAAKVADAATPTANRFPSRRCLAARERPN